MRRAGRKIVFGILVCCLAFSTMTVSATESTKEKLKRAQDEKAQTESQLSDTQSNIENMQGEKSTLQGQLNTLNSELTKVSDNLADLEERIEKKEAEIEKTQADLEEAKATEQWQYECMKKRVQYMYESRQTTVIEMLISATGFGNFLNQSDYVEQVSEYDRTKLKEYQATKQMIAEEEALLEQEKKELDEYKQKVEEEQARVSGLVDQTAGSISSYNNQIAKAEAAADALEDKIKEQNDNIEALQKQLAEEIRLSQLAARSSWRDISQVNFSEEDRNLLAALIYCEAGNQGYDGQLAVGAVVINRVLSSVYPDSVVGVIYQNRQFSPVSSGRFALALANGSATSSCYAAAEAAMSGQTNVGNCVYFRTPVEGLSGIVIGGHVFY